MGNLGGGEILVILLVALVVLGPTRLPEAARQVGRVARELKRMSGDFQRELRQAVQEPVAETKALLKEPVAETKALLKEPVQDSTTGVPESPRPTQQPARDTGPGSSDQEGGPAPDSAESSEI